MPAAEAYPEVLAVCIPEVLRGQVPTAAYITPKTIMSDSTRLPINTFMRSNMANSPLTQGHLSRNVSGRTAVPFCSAQKQQPHAGRRLTRANAPAPSQATDPLRES